MLELTRFRGYLILAHPYRCRRFAGSQRNVAWFRLRSGGLPLPTFCQFAWHTRSGTAPHVLVFSNFGTFLHDSLSYPCWCRSRPSDRAACDEGKDMRRRSPAGLGPCPGRPARSPSRHMTCRLWVFRYVTVFRSARFACKCTLMQWLWVFCDGAVAERCQPLEATPVASINNKQPIHA